MTSPNVGKITLDAVVNTAQVKPGIDQFARDVTAKLLPGMAELDKVITHANKEMAKVTSKPYADLAKEVGVVADQHNKVTKAVLSEKNQRLALAKVVERNRKDVEKRAALNKAALKQIKEEGVLSEALEKRRTAARNAARLSLRDVKRAEEALAAAKKKISAERVADEKRMQAEVDKTRRAHVSYLSKVIGESRKAQDAMVKDAQRATDAIIREAERRKRAIEKAARDEERASERAANAAERAAIRARRAAEQNQRDRRERRSAIRGGVLGPIDVIGEIGRGFAGLGHLSTPAFNTVVLGALTAGGAVASLSKAVFLLPAAFTAAGAGVATLMVGLNGFGDTMKQLMDGDLEKFSVALRNLSPNAQQAALGFQKVLPRLHEFRLAVQDALFANAEPVLTALTDRFLPPLQQFTTQLATAMNKAFTGVADVLMQPETMTQVQVIFDNIVRSFEMAGPSLAQFTQAFVTITEAGSKFLPGLAEKFTGMATAFANFIAEKDRSGDLGEWIQRGLDTGKQLVDIAWDLGRAFMSLAPIAEQILPHLVELLHDVANILEKHPALIYAIPAAFIGWATISGVISLMKTLATIEIVLGATGAGSIGAAATAGAAAITRAFAPLMAAGGAFSVLLRVAPLLGVGAIPDVKNAADLGLMMGPDGRPVDRIRVGGTPGPAPMPRSTLDRLHNVDGADAVINSWMPNPQNLELPPLPPEKNKKTAKDYLSGQTRGPLTEISDANKRMLTQLEKDIKKTPMPGTTMGPFGTPIKPRNRGYEMASAFISALGGDPEVFIGENPIKQAENNWKDFLDRVAETTRAQLEPLLAQPKYDPATHPGLYTPGQLSGQPMGANWDALAKFESGGKWDANTKNGFFGGLQFTKETWMANKPPGAPDNAWEATRAQQIAAAENVLKSQGKGAWPAAAAQHPEWFQPQPGAAMPVMGGGMPGVDLGVRNAAPTVPPPDEKSLRAWVEQNFGIKSTFGTGSWENASHDYDKGWHHMGQNLVPGGAKSGYGFDFSGGRQQMDALANWISTNMVGQTLELIYQSPGFDPANLIKNAQKGTSAYDSDLLAQHAGHVHWATAGAPWQAGATDGMVPPGTGMVPGLTAPGMVPGLSPILGSSPSGVTPVYVMNWPGQTQGSTQAQQMLGMLNQNLVAPAAQATGQAAGGVAGDVAKSFLGAILPQARAGPASDINQLVKERNPLTLLGMAGLNIPDFTVQGGGASAQNLTLGQGPATDAQGRVFSDTAALIDRSFSSQEASNQARHEQLLSVMNQIADRLGTDLLEPVVSSGVSAGIEGLSNTAMTQLGTTLGTQIGQTAGPIIAAAVRDAIPPPQQSGGGAGDLVSGLGGLIGGMAAGGGVSGGTAGKDSVPAMLMPGEWVLTADQVNRLGGFDGMNRLTKGMRHYATGGGVIGNEHVGSEFFGVSQIPGLNIIVDLLVRVLLQVLGVQIEVRDTLDEMSDGFREFRGQFQAFDAMGRLMNDTSALIDRTSTSEQAAADERIRILKIVIDALIKYVIEKVIVPIGKAIGNAVVQAGASAAGMAINSQAPGAGSIVSSLISSAGSAGIEIFAEVGSDLAVALSSVLIEVLFEGLQSMLPDLMTTIFSGAALAGIFDPLVSLAIDPILAIFGGLAGLIGGAAFDEGGLASGTGMMPKATIAPERVLSPHQTASFDRLVAVLERGQFGAGNTRTVNANITMHGSQASPENVRDYLLAKMS